MQAFYDGMTIVGSLVVMAAIITLTYFASRWYAGRMRRSVSGSHIRIIDRVSVSPGCALIVVQAGEKYYLVGASDKNMQLLCVLDGFEPGEPGSPETQASFSRLFEGFLNRSVNPKNDGVEK